MRTGIRHIKGGKSKQEDIGRDCLLYFYWQGKDCTVADKGTAALMMSEIDSDEGPQVKISYLLCTLCLGNMSVRYMTLKLGEN